MSRLLLVLALAAACLRGASAQAQGPLIEKDVGHYGIWLESRSPVLSWESEGVKVFVLSGGGEIRQGPVRMAAAALVVWLDKEVSRRPDVRAATVRVYAEGAGTPGKKATEPVRLVEDRTVREASAICLRLRSTVGLAWDCMLLPVDDLQKVPLYRRAEATVRDALTDLVLEAIPETPGVSEKEVVVRGLLADEIHFFMDEKEGQVTAVYLGDVRGSYGNVDLNSDVAVVWSDLAGESYEMYARGNVILRRKPGVPAARLSEEMSRVLGRFETFRADEMYINSGRERGLASRGEMRFEPMEANPDLIYVIRGREVYMLDSRNLFMREGSITTCPFSQPHYQFTGERVRVVHEDPSVFVTGWDVKLRAGKESSVLFGLPFLATDLGKREGFLLSSIAVGVSSKFGAFIKTRWRPTHLGLEADWIKDWLVHLDYYGARGPGVGTDLEYGFGGPGGARHSGLFTAYYVHDSGKEDDTGLPVPETERGRLSLRHRAEWDPHWRTDAEFYWLSDSGFLNEYFEREFEEEKAPENYLFTRYRRDNLWAGLLFKVRLNDFLTQLEEKPSLELQWVGVPIGPLVYDASFETGLYDLQVSKELALEDPPALVRAHTEHKLSAPLSLGFVRLDPFVRVLGTWASKGAMSGGSYTGAQSRVGVGAGIRASADFSRSYDVSSDLFALNRLRHILTPYVEAESLSFVRGESADFIQLGGYDPWPRGGSGPRIPDDRIDSIRDGEQIRVGLRQRLQTKRPSAGTMQTVDWMELDVAYVGHSGGSDADRDDYVDADFNWRLRPGLTIFSRDDRWSLGDGTDVFNVGAEIDLPRDSRFSLSYHYISDLSSSIIASFTGMLSDRYGLRVLEKFELNSRGAGERQNLQTEVTIRRFFHEWILDVGVRYSKANNDFAILFGFSPVGLDFWQW